MAYNFDIQHPDMMDDIVNEISAEMKSKINLFNNEAGKLFTKMYYNTNLHAQRLVGHCKLNGKEKYYLTPVWYEMPYQVSAIIDTLCDLHSDIDFYNLFAQLPPQYPGCLPVDRDRNVHAIVEMLPKFYNRSQVCDAFDNDMLYCNNKLNFISYCSYLIWLYKRSNVKNIYIGVHGIGLPSMMTDSGMIFWHDIISSWQTKDTTKEIFKGLKASKTLVLHILETYYNRVNTVNHEQEIKIGEAFRNEMLRYRTMMSYDVDITIDELLSKCTEICKSITGSPGL